MRKGVVNRDAQTSSMPIIETMSRYDSGFSIHPRIGAATACCALLFLLEVGSVRTVELFAFWVLGMMCNSRDEKRTTDRKGLQGDAGIDAETMTQTRRATFHVYRPTPRHYVFIPMQYSVSV